VVTLGTMRTFGFRRLINRLVQILPRGDDTLWQTGCTDTSGLPIKARAALPARELDQAMREADVVVSHAGTGSALAALEAGKRPVLVPRSRALQEHIDDHQHQTAKELARRGLAVAASTAQLGDRDLITAASSRILRLGELPPFQLSPTSR
jgi:UDP-N-acetylglucosamine transferase subunit ALG13